jgi:hypothetical protein
VIESVNDLCIHINVYLMRQNDAKGRNEAKGAHRDLCDSRCACPRSYLGASLSPRGGDLDGERDLSDMMYGDVLIE